MRATSGELVVEARAGSEDALAELLARHADDLRRWVDARIGAPYRAAFDADDVLQVTFVECFLRIRQFDPQSSGSFFAWLRRIAERNLLDAMRVLDRAKRPDRRRFLTDKVSEDTYLMLLANLESDGTTPSTAYARAEARRRIDEALEQIPPDYARVVRMYDLMGHPADDLAECMRCSRGTVYMLRARAHERLAELLAAEADLTLRSERRGFKQFA